MAAKQQHTHLLHVVAVPYPAQGHINPLLQLCEQLAPYGFTFTLINTSHIHQRLHRARDAHHYENGSCDVLEQQDTCHHEHVHVPHAPEDEDGHHIRKLHDEHDVDATAADSHVDVRAHEVHHSKGCSSIRMVFIEGGCAPEQHAHQSTRLDAFKAAQEMCEPVERLLPHIMEERAVDFFMSDILLGWSSATARKFGLPWLSFWGASAASLSEYIYFSDLANQEDACIPFAEMDDEEAPLFEGIAGLPPMSRCDVPKMWDAQGKLVEIMCNCFKEMQQAVVAAVVVNSGEELEGQVLRALSKRFPIQAVGPLLPPCYLLHTCPDNREEGSLGRPSLFAEDMSCLAWLDTQAPSSVLFISFGSISLRSDTQLEELAKGVEASGCPFLWVRKPDISNRLDKHRFSSHENGPPHGLIVRWAPQLQVLSHPSVGGFITHCGWNSVIESASMGVPMLCWADTGERRSNQRFVVEFWKCGIDMVSDMRRAKQHIDEEGLVGREDIEKSIRFLMLEEGGASIRVKSAKLREGAIKSYQDSHARMNQFTQTMKQRCHHLVSNGRYIST